MAADSRGLAAEVVDVRAFGLKLGLDPLEVEAACLDHREFLRSHPKSKQTLTTCLLHHARKKRERGPAQQELPGIRGSPRPSAWQLDEAAYREQGRASVPMPDALRTLLGPGVARATDPPPTLPSLAANGDSS